MRYLAQAPPPLFHHLAPLFASSVQLWYIPTASKLATLPRLIIPEKLPSLTTSYRPISLFNSIMIPFERVSYTAIWKEASVRIESKHDHLFRLSQSVMDCFYREEHVITTFLDIEKTFDNVWHNWFRYKNSMLDLPTKMTSWLSHFLVSWVIKVSVNCFMGNQIYPKKRGSTGFCPESINLC